MKFCYKCNQKKPFNRFWKNKTKPDGLQNTCIDCKDSWGKSFTCLECGSGFNINHRNIRSRRSFLCGSCAKRAAGVRAAQRNKERAKPFIHSSRGYIYLKEQEEKCGYQLAHRKAMEKHLGRKLRHGEVVHHIDGDKRNNDISNLFLTNNPGHAAAHRSIELIGYHLMREGKLQFNKELGVYQLVD